MSYLLFSLSLMLIYVGLAQLLHIQFGLLGVPNFGVVGIWGFGMYGVAVLSVQYDMPFLIALLLSAGAMAALAYGLGRLMLRLEGQAILCGTLAFSAIVALLVVTEKWLTLGVVGIGTVRYPVDTGASTEFLYFLLLLAVVFGLQSIIRRLHRSRLGRLILAVRDNEELAGSLGKDTFALKLGVFTLTSTAMAVLGGLSAPLNQFLTPNMIVPGLTFAIWIAVVLGGKEAPLGPVVGVIATFGLFDILIETYAPVAPEYAVMVPNLKLFLYGALLVGVLMYVPSGLAGHPRFRRLFALGTRT
ncbi:MAG: branched-chain amino acid ABC transporter permease [Pseudomonadota bacterium]